jgi:putative hydrolase of HD superfamily
MSKPDIHRLLELQNVLLQFRAIERSIYLPPGTDKHENDVEHSYSLAMAAWFLSQSFPELESDKVIRLSLVHDLIEVHAGDTYAYSDDVTLSTKEAREKEAFHKLSQEWQDFPEMLTAIEEYEARQTAEAKFVYALDKIQPAMLDYLNQGVGWRKLGITHAMFRTEKDRKVPVSPQANEYMDQLHEALEPFKHLFAEPVEPSSK